MTESDFQLAKTAAASRYLARICKTEPIIVKPYTGPVPVAEFVDNFKLPTSSAQHKRAWEVFFQRFNEFYASHRSGARAAQ